MIDKDGEEVESGLIIIDELVKTISFNNIKSRPIPSWFRGFSAPIKFTSDLSIKNKVYLASSDTDPFNRWDSAQSLWLEYILSPDQVIEKDLFQMIRKVIDNESDYSLLSEMISLPSEQIIHQNVGKIDVLEVHNQRNQSILSVAKAFKVEFLELYHQLNTPKAFDLSTQSIGERALKNKCLNYLSKIGEYDIAYQQFNNAECMTDQFGAFQCLLDSETPYRAEVINNFYQQHRSDVQVMDKWFSAQCIASASSVGDVRGLMKHELFSMTNPNRIRSVIGSFSQNGIQFHCEEGYRLLTEVIIELDHLNPQIAARFAGIYNHWRRFTSQYSMLQEKQLQSIIQEENLSKDVYEIIHSALKGA